MGSLKQLQRNYANLKIDASRGYAFSVSSVKTPAFHWGLLSSLADIFITMYSEWYSSRYDTTKQEDSKFAIRTEIT